MKKYWLFLIPFFLSGCYTSVQFQYPVKQQRTQVTHLLAIDSNGDTVRVQPHDFRLLYNNNPTYYSGWKIYHRNIWITPYSYYRYYYRPYQPIYVHYPYSPPTIKKDNQSPQTRADKPSQPRSSGTTTGQTRSSGTTTRQTTKDNETSRTSTTRRTRNQ